MDIYSSFGIIDLIVIACGFYGFYSWYMLVYKHEIIKTFLVGTNTNPEGCTDIEAFAGFMGTKLLLLSAATVIFGGICAYNSYGPGIGNFIWPCIILFLAIIVWYCVQLRKADSLYFSTGAKKGESIKNKALKK